MPHPPLTAARWARGLVTWLVVAAVAASLALLAGHASVPVRGVSALLPIFGLVFLVNLAGWVPSTLARTERYYDLLGSVSHLVAVLSAAAIAGFAPAAIVLIVPVAVWAGRLGLHLATRAHREGDARFDQIKLDPARFALAWALQSLWTCLNTLGVLVAVTLAGTDPAGPAVPPPISGWTAAGLFLWGLGFAVEVTADRQKLAFRADAVNRGRFIQGGLWSWSRHPNYVGEVVLWIGLFVAGVPAYSGAGWLAALSPLFVYGLLRYGSGVPLLEARADARWGGQPDYEAYKAAVPVLWPRPPRPVPPQPGQPR